MQLPAGRHRITCAWEGDARKGAAMADARVGILILARCNDIARLNKVGHGNAQ